MRKLIEKVFSRTELRRKGRGRKLEKVTVAPSERFVYVMMFCVVALVMLTILEVTHLVFVGVWNSEIFSAITTLIGAIIGAFIGAKA